ncbi:hypothetical protein D3C78_1398800 [compost metagenome]
MIQRIDIRHQTIKQIGLAEASNAARRQRQDLFKGKYPQMGQHAESGIVADHAFGVAPGGAENGGTPHTGSRQHVVEGKQTRQPGEGRGGKEPAGQRQQADAGQQRDDGQQDA